MENSPSKMIWAGRFLTGLFALFMLGASIAPKLLSLAAVDDSLTQVGWPLEYRLMIGGLELIFLTLYLFPPTSLLGAVLMTALLGGAMAAQIRVGSPLFSHVLFSIYLGLFMWGGLWLRQPELRKIFPIWR
jgi:hypothetical protein